MWWCGDNDGGGGACFGPASVSGECWAVGWSAEWPEKLFRPFVRRFKDGWECVSVDEPLQGGNESLGRRIAHHRVQLAIAGAAVCSLSRAACSARATAASAAVVLVVALLLVLASADAVVRTNADMNNRPGAAWRTKRVATMTTNIRTDRRRRRRSHQRFAVPWTTHELARGCGSTPPSRSCSYTPTSAGMRPRRRPGHRLMVPNDRFRLHEAIPADRCHPKSKSKRLGKGERPRAARTLVFPFFFFFSALVSLVICFPYGHCQYLNGWEGGSTKYEV